MSKKLKKMSREKKDLITEIKSFFSDVVSHLSMGVGPTDQPAAVVRYYPYVSNGLKPTRTDVEYYSVGNGLTEEEALIDLLSKVRKMKANN